MRICHNCGKPIYADDVVWGDLSEAAYCSDDCKFSGEEAYAESQAQDRAESRADQWS